MGIILYTPQSYLNTINSRLQQIIVLGMIPNATRKFEHSVNNKNVTQKIELNL